MRYAPFAAGFHGPRFVKLEKTSEDPMSETCPHVETIRNVTPSSLGCEECLKLGMSWVHLRECLSCGHVGCCDSSVGKHATRHFKAKKHAMIRSFEPGEDWAWCYVDEITFEPAPIPRAA
jgi:uncharacterized UBP type Zn finger protein